MSIRSYFRNVQRGASGPGRSTCWPAALEQISPNHSLIPQDYRNYTAMVLHHNQLTPYQQYKNSPNVEQICSKILYRLGELTCRDLYYVTPKSASHLKKMVGELLVSKYRVVVEIETDEGNSEDCHSLGLLPGKQRGKVRAFSNWVPNELKSEFPIENIFPILAKPQYIEIEEKMLDGEDYPWIEHSVSALPNFKTKG